MAGKCFCHLNGHEVKDAYARKKIQDHELFLNDLSGGGSSGSGSRIKHLFLKGESNSLEFPDGVIGILIYRLAGAGNNTEIAVNSISTPKIMIAQSFNITHNEGATSSVFTLGIDEKTGKLKLSYTGNIAPYIELIYQEIY